MITLSTSVLRRLSAQPDGSTVVKEVFTLDSGTVTITLPAVLTDDDYTDLADYIAVVLRRIKRRTPGASNVSG